MQAVIPSPKKDNDLEQIILRSDEGDVACYVVAQTVLGGRTYILTTVEEEGDGQAIILRDDSGQGDADALYTVVEDDDELEKAAEAFGEILAEDGVELDL